MPILPYSLYGNDSTGYLVLMSLYNSGKSREYNQILSYLVPGTGYTYGSVKKDPPWRGSLTKYFKDLPDDHDLSFLLYLPIRKNEELWVSAEMRRWQDMELVGKQDKTRYFESDTTVSNASLPVHFTNPAHDWGHARIQITSSIPGQELRDTLSAGGALEYYLVRLTIRSVYDGEAYHWEDTGVLEVQNDL